MEYERKVYRIFVMDRFGSFGDRKKRFVSGFGGGSKCGGLQAVKVL